MQIRLPSHYYSAISLPASSAAKRLSRGCANPCRRRSGSSSGAVKSSNLRSLEPPIERWQLSLAYGLSQTPSMASHSYSNSKGGLNSQ